MSNREGYVKRMKEATEAMMTVVYETDSKLPPRLVKEATSKIDLEWCDYSSIACQCLIKFVDSRVRELFVLGGIGAKDSAFMLMTVLMTHLQDDMLPLLLSMKAANLPPPKASSDWKSFLMHIASGSTCSLKRSKGYMSDEVFITGVKGAGGMDGKVLFSCCKGGGISHILGDTRTTTNKHYESLKGAATRDDQGKMTIKVQYPRIIVVVWLLNEALKGPSANVRNIKDWDTVCGNSSRRRTTIFGRPL